MKKRGWMFVLFILLVLPMVIAVPPVFTSIEAESQGLQITFPIIEFYPFNKNFTLNFHVANSTGFFLDTNETNVSCHIHVYDNVGIHVVNEDLFFHLEDGDFEYTSTREEFPIGDYTYLANCNCSNELLHEAGFISSSFKVTADGFDNTVKDTTGSLAITIFILLTTAALFALPFFVRFTKNEISNVILRRCCWVLGIYLMMLNSSMLATIASQSHIILTKELFRYMWLFGTVGYIFMGFVVLKTIFDVLELSQEMILEKRMGGNHGEE